MIIMKMDTLYLVSFDKDNKQHLEFVMELLHDETIKERFQGIFTTLSNISDDIYDSAYLVKDGNELIGYIDISNLDDDGAIYLREAVSEKHRGNCYGSRILKEVTKFLFNNVGEVERIKLRIASDNISSLKTADACGYKWLEKDYYYKDNMRVR